MAELLVGDRLAAAYRAARDALFAERHSDGYWLGELSSSALSTATAISALTLSGGHNALVEAGTRWLVGHQNSDGGWGDTNKSFSNISTTMLCRAAIRLAGNAESQREALEKADAWLREKYGPAPEQWPAAVRQRYGKDRTFSVPILMNCALAGLVAWTEVPALPFELACLPQSWYRFAGLPVVSYALPALIAIGQCIFEHNRPRNMLLRWIRKKAIIPSLRLLERIQPESGGFLEATPLTSFVVMALVSVQKEHSPAKPQAASVIHKGIDFLVRSVRPDGSWPIDSNLSVWVTTLAVNALAAAGDVDSIADKEKLRQWILDQQETERHPYTGAAPGGWGWSHLSGSVPDADDTSGALLALRNLGADRDVARAARAGEQWLCFLLNLDGGVPTFCRGWGKLPFDRSGADLTAHGVRAVGRRIRRALANDSLDTGDPRTAQQIAFTFAGLSFLGKQQRTDGSWLPLWFGNQHAAGDENPTYGTSRVLAAYRDLALTEWPACPRGVKWLLANQNEDGGWGGSKGCPSSIEETALAVEVLLDLVPPEAQPAVERGLMWLIERVEGGGLKNPAPIGFYFAKLWYFEKLYPIIFAVAALGRALRKFTPTRSACEA
jgi:squalene-hopene/tetraprenyl-beta-curcumene cyclase